MASLIEKPVLRLPNWRRYHQDGSIRCRTESTVTAVACENFLNPGILVPLTKEEYRCDEPVDLIEIRRPTCGHERVRWNLKCLTS